MLISSNKIKLLIINQDSIHCFCGNQADTSTFTQSSPNDCNTICGGNISQVCGGNWSLSIYKLGISYLGLVYTIFMQRMRSYGAIVISLSPRWSVRSCVPLHFMNATSMRLLVR